MIGVIFHQGVPTFSSMNTLILAVMLLMLLFAIKWQREFMRDVKDLLTMTKSYQQITKSQKDSVERSVATLAHNTGTVVEKATEIKQVAEKIADTGANVIGIPVTLEVFHQPAERKDGEERRTGHDRRHGDDHPADQTKEDCNASEATVRNRVSDHPDAVRGASPRRRSAEDQSGDGLGVGDV